MEVYLKSRAFKLEIHWSCIAVVLIFVHFLCSSFNLEVLVACDVGCRWALARSCGARCRGSENPHIDWKAQFECANRIIGHDDDYGLQYQPCAAFCQQWTQGCEMSYDWLSIWETNPGWCIYLFHQKELWTLDMLLLVGTCSCTMMVLNLKFQASSVLSLVSSLVLVFQRNRKRKFCIHLLIVNFLEMLSSSSCEGSWMVTHLLVKHVLHVFDFLLWQYPHFRWTFRLCSVGN